MNFDGPAPELINGRLAMLGFTAAMAAELTSQETAFSQFLRAPGTILAVSGLIIVASLIPIVRGTKTLDDGKGEDFVSNTTLFWQSASCVVEYKVAAHKLAAK